jgi:uncharacterized protein YgbK (DUF1537 family)
LGDTPIHLSPFASDRLNPITTSDVKTLVERGIREAEIKGIEVVSITAERVSSFDLPPASSKPKRVFVFDASTDEQLSRIGRRLGQRGLLHLSAGCAGFASVLPKSIDFSHSPLRKLPLHEPLLVINGSMTALSRRQVERAAEADYDRTTLSLESKLTPQLSKTGRGKKIIRALVDRLGRGKNCIITTSASAPEAERDYVSSQNVSEDRIASLIAGNLAEITRGILDILPLSSLIIFGGDTALAAFKTLNIERLIPVGEILAGIPVSLAEDRGLTVVTKSGGFGTDDVLCTLQTHAIHRRKTLEI